MNPADIPPREDTPADTPLQGKNQREWLRPFQWKKGQSGNPSGRPKGSLSMKAFARQYLERMPYKHKLAFMKELPPEIIWRMAEGNPHQATSEEITVTRPVPLDDVLVATFREVIPELKSEADAPKLTSASPVTPIESTGLTSENNVG